MMAPCESGACQRSRRCTYSKATLFLLCLLRSLRTGDTWLQEALRAKSACGKIFLCGHASERVGTARSSSRDSFGGSCEYESTCMYSRMRATGDCGSIWPASNRLVFSVLFASCGTCEVLLWTAYSTNEHCPHPTSNDFRRAPFFAGFRRTKRRT